MYWKCGCQSSFTKFANKYNLTIYTYTHYSDTELVKECLKGKDRAQYELYQRFSYTMFGVCTRYAGNREEAEDILQESFLKVFKSLSSYQPIGPLGGWIRRIVINTALENYRKKKFETLQLDNQFSNLNMNQDDSVLDELALADLTKLIQELPIGYRTVFNLYAVEGYMHSEIASMLDISEGTSKSQYSKAKNVLREKIIDANHSLKVC